jgi:CheY-like chemotaxis protein
MSGATSTAKKRILIVDDEPLIIEVLSEHFKTSYDIETAVNGTEALAAVLRQRPDLMLLDINMPRMNGIELLREIRRDPVLAELKVVVLTTSSEDRDRVDANQLGITSYLVKPVTFSAFADAVAGLGTAWNLITM